MSVLRRVSFSLIPVALLATTGCNLQPNDNVLPGQTATGDDGYTVSVSFDHIQNLVQNSVVMYRDAKIGTVTRIELDDWTPQVTLRLLDDVELPENARFTVGQKTLLGAQYIEVTDPGRPSPEQLADGADVPLERSGGYPETEHVLAAAALLLNNGGLSQISTITGELSQALDHRRPDARALIGRLEELLAAVNRNRDDVIGALEEIDGLSATLAAERTNLGRAIDEAAPALRMLNREQDKLVRAVNAAGMLSGRAVELVDATEADLLSTLSSLRPTLAQLSTVSTVLPEALKFMLTLPFPVMTTGNVVVGDYANLFVTVDLTGSTLGGNFGTWLPGLQAANPLAAPLQPTNGGRPSGGLPLSSLPLLDSVGSLLAPTPAPAPSGGSSGAPQDACGLLSLLGGC